MKISNTRARMEELFALKRQDRPPKNYFRDFILEFHRRIGASAAKPSPSASKRKDTKRS